MSRRELSALTAQIMRVLRRRSLPDSEVDEAVLETLAILSARTETVSRLSGENLRRYLSVVASGVAANFWRRRWNHLRSASGETEELTTEAQLDPSLALDLERVLVDERRTNRLGIHVLLLFAVHGLTDRDIAAQLAIPLGTVKTRKRRAQQALQRTLGRR